MTTTEYIAYGLLSYSTWIDSYENDQVNSKFKGKSFSERATIFEGIYSSKISSLSEDKKSLVPGLKSMKILVIAMVFRLLPDLALLLAMLIKGVIVTSSMLGIVVDIIIFLIWMSDCKAVLTLCDKYPEKILNIKIKIINIIFWMTMLSVISIIPIV